MDPAGGLPVPGASHGGPALVIPQDWPNRSSSREVEAAGTRWHVQRMGNGSPILLVHGTGASTHTWRDVMPLLAESYDVLAVDLPGHGFSGRLPGDSMALAAIADGLGELLDRIGVCPTFAVGHSAGAAVLIEMSMDGLIEPSCVVGLNAALLPLEGRVQRFFSPLARALAGSRTVARVLARRADDPAAIDRLLTGTGSVLDARGVDLYQRLFACPKRIAAVLQMMASWDLHGLCKRLDRFRTPLYLVTAAGDSAVAPGQARQVAALAPDAHVIEMGQGGHLSHEEFPEQTAKLIHALCKDGYASGITGGSAGT